MLKIDAAQPEILPFHLFHCQNLVAALPTRQLDFRQFSQRFRCVLLAASDVASNSYPRAEMRMGDGLQRSGRQTSFYVSPK